jgi:hypothetical protein
VHAGTARQIRFRSSALRVAVSCGLAAFTILFGCAGLRNAVADGVNGTADRSGTISSSGELEVRAPHAVAAVFLAQVGGDDPAAQTTALTTRAATSSGQAPSALTPTATTIAVKRNPGQATSTLITAHPHVAATVTSEVKFEEPWLDAIMLSPSIRRYLTTSMLGGENYRALAKLIEKPASSVVMRFSTDPNPGLTPDHFSGSAVSFVSIVTYPTQTTAVR